MLSLLCHVFSALFPIQRASTPLGEVYAAYQRFYGKTDSNFALFCRSYEGALHRKEKFLTSRADVEFFPSLGLSVRSRQISSVQRSLQGKVAGAADDILHHSGTVAKAKASTPLQLDQRELGLQTFALDQGLYCGSCYAIAAAAALETSILAQLEALSGAFPKLQNKSTRNLRVSPEFLMQQSRYTAGCDGGDAQVLFYELQSRIRQIDLVTSTTQQLQQIQALSSEQLQGLVPFESIVVIHEYSEQKFDAEIVALIKEALASFQPVIGAMKVEGSQAFANFNGGILRGAQCKEFGTDHQIVFVGYGTFKGQEVFVVKNTWGAGWGDLGYFYVRTDEDPFCIMHYAATITPAYGASALSDRLTRIYDGELVRGKNGLDRENGSYENWEPYASPSVLILALGIAVPSAIGGCMIALMKHFLSKKKRAAPGDRAE